MSSVLHVYSLFKHRIFRKSSSIQQGCPEVTKIGGEGRVENFSKEILENFRKFSTIFKIFLKKFQKILKNFNFWWGVTLNFRKLSKNFLKILQKKHKIFDYWGGRHGPNNPPSEHP
jgi:hypothetical protein